MMLKELNLFYRSIYLYYFRYAGTVKLSETLPHTNVIVTAVKL